MSNQPRWVSMKALLLLHEESLATFGGAPGLRNEGLLATALARPRNRYTYDADTTISDLAASYLFGLAKNHPFVDGNKRIAFLATGIFLALNGFRLTAGKVEAIPIVTAVAAGELEENGLSTWIEKNCLRRH